MTDLIERLRRQRKVYNGRSTFREEIVNPDGPEAADQLSALRERVEALEGALRPFANAAAGVAAFDPDYPMDGAALRASFDWYDKAQSEPLKRHSVRRSDLERARAILAQHGGEDG